MMNKITAAVCAIFFLVLISSCVETAPTIEEGQQTSVKLNISVPKSGTVAVTKATDEQETKLNSLVLLFYKSDNSLPIVIEQKTFGLPEVVTNTSYTYTVEASDENLTSGKWYLYAIANGQYTGFGDADPNIIASMTKAEMDNYIVVKKNELLDLIDDGLLLTGKYGDDGEIVLLPSGNDFTGDAHESLHLRRATAKITFNLATASDVEFVPEQYTVYNYSQSSTLIERSGWQQKDGTTSYTFGTFPGSLEYAGAETASERFMTAKRYIAGNTFTFYMPENVQKPKASVTGYNSREKRNMTEANPAARDFKLAPDDGTYVVITGRYRGPGAKYDDQTGEYVQDKDNTVSGEVSYTIHLGNFSSGATHSNTKGGNDNFTVRRNVHYTYNVSINGSKNIIVEALTDVENNSGAEGFLAPDINAIDLDSHFETVMLELPTEYNTDFMLGLITPYDNTLHTISDMADRPDDIKWVSFARPDSTCRFPAYPGDQSDSLTDIFGLLQELKSFNGESGAHYTYKDGKIYVVAFIDEYYYDTIPGTSQKAPLSDFINAPDRQMNVLYNIDISKDTYSAYAHKTLFTIHQSSIKSMYDLSVANPMGIETYEEFPGPVDRKQDRASSDPENWGWGNFASNFSLGTDLWADYVNTPRMGHMDNNTEIPTIGLEQNYGDIQCISRNRDENGNGIIDREEIKWYLPSHNECLTIWNGYYALSDQARVNEDHQHYTSTNGYARYWWNDEGSAFGEFYALASFYTPVVRCVRALGTYDAVTTSVSSVDGQVISLSGLGNGATRSTGKRGEYIGGHYRNDPADILPTSFRVAKNDLSFTGKEVFVISAPRVSYSGYDMNGIYFLLQNYNDLIDEGYSLYYTVGNSTTKVPFNSESVLGITPLWVDDEATVNIYASITNDGTEYVSNVTTVSVKRTRNEVSGYLYTTEITHGSNNTSDSTYPYVDAAEYNDGELGFRINNFNRIGSMDVSVNVQRGAKATSGSWIGAYPYVENATANSEYLTVTLYDIQDGWYWYVSGQSGQTADTYTGGTKFGASTTAQIPLSSLVWNGNTAYVTVYSSWGGYSGTYLTVSYQTKVTVTRSLIGGKASYTVNNGDWHEITAEKTFVPIEESMWNSDESIVKVFNNNYLGANYLSTITLRRVQDNYSYETSFVNGIPNTISKSNTVTRSTFTPAEVKGSNYCEQYYYEEADKSDLGMWRIPNERELGLMYQYFNLTATTAARSLYYRKFDDVPTSKPYSLTATGGNIFTGGLSSYVIRCVRDN